MKELKEEEIMKLFRFLFLGMVLLLVSCKKETSVIQKVNASPKEIFEHNGIRIPYYDFDEFEKFLSIKDDEVYVVNFWATWCQPCVEELPYFESINTTYKHKGVNVLLVSLDRKRDVETRLIPFMKQQNIRSEVILLNDANPNYWIPKVNENWSGAIPITIIYNKNKKQFYEKTFTLEELKNEIEKFL